VNARSGDDTAKAPGDAAGMSSTRYRIVVRGRLTERFGSAFEDMTLELLPGQTALVGEFVDETALYGLLDRLRDFNLQLVSVNAVD
jgi:hypothetical protein